MISETSSQGWQIQGISVMLVPFHSRSQKPTGLPADIPGSTGCLCVGSRIRRRCVPPARPAEQCRVQPGPSGPGERGGKSIVGNGWEQGSCDRNIGTSSLREAGEAGRRRNLSRKRTFVSDTSKNKISSCRRNVLNIGSAASLAHHSFQHSCKAFSKKRL